MTQRVRSSSMRAARSSGVHTAKGEPVPFLLAELDRVKAERDELLRDGFHMSAELDRTRAELERLKTKREDYIRRGEENVTRLVGDALTWKQEAQALREELYQSSGREAVLLDQVAMPREALVAVFRHHTKSGAAGRIITEALAATEPKK